MTRAESATWVLCFCMVLYFVTVPNCGGRQVPLPEWQPEWSDGCTILPFVDPAQRIEIQDSIIDRVARDPAAARAACLLHDRAYYYGGSQADRMGADLDLAQAWLAAGVDVHFVDTGFGAIRTFGGPSYQTPGVSWAFGGDVFRYTEQ